LAKFKFLLLGNWVWWDCDEIDTKRESN